MTDFLKSHPFISMEEYLWTMNPCLIKLMTIDYTRIHYLSDKDKKRKGSKVYDGKQSFSDLGVPIFE